MSIAFDAAANSGYQAAQSTYTANITIAGTLRFLAVDVHLLSVPGTTVSGVTHDGVAMTLVGVKSTVSGAGRVECWGLVAPATGVKAIVVTLSAAVASAFTAASYSGVDQVSPTEAFNSAQATNVGAADALVTVTPVSDNTWIHGAVVSDDTSITANQTSRNNVTGALGSGANEDSGGVASGATEVSYTGVAALKTWAIGGYAIRPAQDAPTILDTPTVAVNGLSISMTLSETGCIPASSANAGHFSLSGAPIGVVSWAISGSALTLTLSGVIDQNDTVTLGYTAGTGGITNASLNPLAAFAPTGVTNGSLQTRPPVRSRSLGIGLGLGL